MKRIALLLVPGSLAITVSAAYAQSSVTLYGVIDEAFQFVHSADAEGNNLYRMQGNNQQSPKWGLKGAEELGGGLKVIFQVETVSMSTTVPQGRRLLGHQAYVGLTDRMYGTLTFGRQYDPVVDMVQPLTADNAWGSTFSTPGDVDNNDNSSRTNNAVN